MTTTILLAHKLEILAKKTAAESSSGTKVVKLSKPKDLPQPVGMYLVAQLIRTIFETD